MIKVDDIVRVANWSGQYIVANSWFLRHKDELNFEWVIRYAYGDDTNYLEHRCNDDSKYQVLFIDDFGNVALITDFYATYLIDMDCLELYYKPTECEPTEMTISEIEEELGISNLKIIKEKEDV